MATPKYKIYSAMNEYVAACKYAEDAAALAGVLGEGASIKVDHKLVVWIEGREEFFASESYDGAAAIIFQREKSAHDAAHARKMARWAKFEAASRNRKEIQLS